MLRFRFFRCPAFFVTVLGASACVGSTSDESLSGESNLGQSSIEVVFSPQAADSTHMKRIAKMIDEAKTSVDVAMYSYSDAEIGRALRDAEARGVHVRFVFDTARKEKLKTGQELLSTKSGRLEQDGVDVRWVNKIMHHKFVIVDGPRDDEAAADTALIATGSANWSARAGTEYDENTLFIRGEKELALKLQQEFNLLWEHSGDLVASPHPPDPSSLRIDAVDDSNPDADVVFTSANFTPPPPGKTTFRTTGSDTVAKVLIEGIKSATSSIHIASGHLRSRPIAEALLARANDGLDIRIYLDGQEYISPSAHVEQERKRARCLGVAGSDEQKIRSCNDTGFLFGYAIGKANISVRYKYYAYRWNNAYAAQMHNKFMVVDKSRLFTGSYNLSDNAEHETFENMFQFSGARYQSLVDEYEKRFDALWETGRAERREEALRSKLDDPNVTDVPIVFDAIAMTHDEVTKLKTDLRRACPEIDGAEFRRNAAKYKTCTKGPPPVARP
jgi:phosphatidylserine/phosphatidylglycerophosphate/cardiolipin synthase-like enzyme